MTTMTILELGNLNERITRIVRRLLDQFVRALGDAGPCVDAGNQIVADELFALARRVDRHGLGILIDMLDDPATGTIHRRAPIEEEER